MIGRKYHGKSSTMFFNQLLWAATGDDLAMIHNGDLLMIPEPNVKPVEIPEAEIPVGGTDLHEKIGAESIIRPKPR